MQDSRDPIRVVLLVMSAPAASQVSTNSEDEFVEIWSDDLSLVPNSEFFGGVIKESSIVNSLCSV